MRVFAVDPGSTESAWMALVDGSPLAFGKSANVTVRDLVATRAYAPDVVVIEEVRSYGMPVGREVFDTVRWIGRLEEAADQVRTPVALIGRKDVVVHLCGSARAKDANVRAALIDRFGGTSSTRKSGSLHGVVKDVWSALAIACTWFDQRTEGTR